MHTYTCYVCARERKGKSEEREERERERECSQEWPNFISRMFDLRERNSPRYPAARGNLSVCKPCAEFNGFLIFRSGGGYGKGWSGVGWGGRNKKKGKIVKSGVG